jgi:hypothetical protein
MTVKELIGFSSWGVLMFMTASCVLIHNIYCKIMPDTTKFKLFLKKIGEKTIINFEPKD